MKTTTKTVITHKIELEVLERFHVKSHEPTRAVHVLVEKVEAKNPSGYWDLTLFGHRVTRGNRFGQPVKFDVWTLSESLSWNSAARKELWQMLPDAVREELTSLGVTP